MKRMLDIKVIEKNSALYCNEKAIITIAKYLNRRYEMAFCNMNCIDYLQKEDGQLRFEDRIRASYSEVTMVNALRKYHGILSSFPTKTFRTIIKTIEDQIKNGMPVLIFLSYRTCHNVEKKNLKVDFLVVGFDEEYIMGYDMRENDTLKKIKKELIKKDYALKEKVITWKVVHEEIVISDEMGIKILRNLRKDLKKEIVIIEKIIHDFRHDCNSIENIKESIDYNILLKNFSQVVRAKKLFYSTLTYISHRISGMDEVLFSYKDLGIQWHRVWQLFAKINYMVKDAACDIYISRTAQIIISEMKKIIQNEKHLIGILDKAIS